MLALVHGEVDHRSGVSRQGGSGAGGGMATGRHQAIRLPGRTHSHLRGTAAELECTGCRRPVTGVAVIVAGRVFCTWDCATSVAGTVPGLYFG